MLKRQGNMSDEPHHNWMPTAGRLVVLYKRMCLLIFRIGPDPCPLLHFASPSGQGIYFLSGLIYCRNERKAVHGGGHECHLPREPA